MYQEIKADTPQFMTAASPKVEEKDGKRSHEDAHWRLAFADDGRRKRRRRSVEYVGLSEMSSNGRRTFGVQAAPQEPQQPVSDGDDEEETTETAEQRRAAERKADRDSLKKMKGMTSLSGQTTTTGKRKGGDTPSSNKKKGRRTA